MGSLINLTGKSFGRLTVVGRSEAQRSSGALWLCACVCGGTAVADSLKLRSGHTTSCGCYRKEVLSKLTHGQSKAKTRTYRTWKEMRQRCMNPSNDKWKWYGGRGIKICATWNTFEAFWADMGDRPEGKTLDRIDSDGDYELANCRWATPAEQATTNRGVKRKGATPANRMPDGAVESFIAMRNEGKSLTKISELTGYHGGTISRKINEYLRTIEKVKGVS